MNEPLKFCRDCAHYFPGTELDCRAPQNTALNPVTGEANVREQAALLRALNYVGCGQAAKWFVPKAAS